MRLHLFIVIASAASLLLAQEKIAFSYVDIQSGELRAAVSNADGSNRNDLGFNGTYMPVWMGDALLVSSNYYVWKVLPSGEGMQRVAAGNRPSVSHSQQLFACFIDGGIGVFGPDGKQQALLEVDAWPDAAITWHPSDSMLCYYDKTKDASVLFNFYRDSMALVGKYTVQPVWHTAHQAFAYTKTEPEGVTIYLGSGTAVSATDKRIATTAQFNVSPVWNPAGDAIAFLALQPDSVQSQSTDLLYCDLYLYYTSSGTLRLLAENAAYTDNIYPQLSFSPSGEYLYYTVRAVDEVGELCRIRLTTGEKELLSRDYYSDERYPQCR